MQDCRTALGSKFHHLISIFFQQHYFLVFLEENFKSLLYAKEYKCVQLHVTCNHCTPKVRYKHIISECTIFLHILFQQCLFQQPFLHFLVQHLVLHVSILLVYNEHVQVPKCRQQYSHSVLKQQVTLSTLDPVKFTFVHI